MIDFHVDTAHPIPSTAQLDKKVKGTAGLGLLLVSLMMLCSNLAGCGGGNNDENRPGPNAQPRVWSMGFYHTPPKYGDLAIALTGFELLSQRAEVVMIHQELPWQQLVAGVSPADTLTDPDNNMVALVGYLRDLGLRIYFMADLTDGLNRSSEPPQLVAMDRHITEPAIRQLYIDYVVAVAQTLHPDVLGLTAETNLVRRNADPAVYDAMVQGANDAGAALRGAGIDIPLMISVQVETAWGLLGAGTTGDYLGIGTDLDDFPFVDLLGLSSYPYLAVDDGGIYFNEPEQIPGNYYSRITSEASAHLGRALPVMVAEGGWISVNESPVNSTPEKQARYLSVQADLLDSIDALAVIQTVFTDLDLDSWPEAMTPPTIIRLFSTIGLMELVEDEFVAKPALAVWDASFVRPGM